MNIAKSCPLFVMLLTLSCNAWSHHVLGRPAYNLGEDSNTPPSMQVEVRIGDFLVTAMVFPAFPDPDERGRINIYATNSVTGVAFQDEITFSAKRDSWFGGRKQVLGVQVPYDGVHRQGFEFDREGEYLITASFKVDGETYHFDFPLRIGEPGFDPMVVAAVSLLVLLLGISLLRAKRIQREKVRLAQKATREYVKDVQ